MSWKKVDLAIVEKIQNLRRLGHSIGEIRKITGKGYGTICRYNKDVEVLPEYRERWLAKRGGSKKLAEKGWEVAREKADRLINGLDSVNRLLILSCLYWGEGTKKFDFSISNSDPDLIKVFVNCLKEVGVNKERLRVNIRIYGDIDKVKAIKFWIKTIGVDKRQVTSINVLEGKKKGKLPYGLCRLRVTKGADILKLILSLIDVIKIRCKLPSFNG